MDFLISFSGLDTTATSGDWQGTARLGPGESFRYNKGIACAVVRAIINGKAGPIQRGPCTCVHLSSHHKWIRSISRATAKPTRCNVSHQKRQPYTRLSVLARCLPMQPQ